MNRYKRNKRLERSLHVSRWTEQMPRQGPGVSTWDKKWFPKMLWVKRCRSPVRKSAQVIFFVSAALLRTEGQNSLGCWLFLLGCLYRDGVALWLCRMLNGFISSLRLGSRWWLRDLNANLLSRWWVAKYFTKTAVHDVLSRRTKAGRRLASSRHGWNNSWSFPGPAFLSLDGLVTTPG